MFRALSFKGIQGFSKNSLGTSLNRFRENQFHFRGASQLYPTTSRRWDEAMTQAESIVGDSSGFSNLQKWVSGEFNSITKYLQKLVGTNHPMLETAKRCTYIGEGRMGSSQARGLTVILTAKAVEDLSKYSSLNRKEGELIRNQISLAEMTEMTFSAYMIHRGVMDLKMHGLEEVDYVSPNKDDSYMINKHARGIHYGNKVSILCGDFLLAYVMRGLGDLFSSKVVDLVSTSITDFMEGEFLLLDDWRSQSYLLSEESRDLNRWMRRAYCTIGSLQGNTCQATLVLANIEGNLQRDAREFGKNLGFAWQAHTELQPFLKDRYEPIELSDMPPYPAFDLNCLPVLMFLRRAYQERNFRLMLDQVKGSYSNELNFKNQVGFIHQHRHQEAVDYKKIHNLVLEEENSIKETQKVIQEYSQKAIGHLESFPPSEAKEALSNICESLYKI